MIGPLHPIRLISHFPQRMTFSGTLVSKLNIHYYQSRVDTPHKYGAPKDPRFGSHRSDEIVQPLTSAPCEDSIQNLGAYQLRSCLRLLTDFSSEMHFSSQRSITCMWIQELYIPEYNTLGCDYKEAFRSPPYCTLRSTSLRQSAIDGIPAIAILR